ncbi:MAG TPA: MFS transporter [Thermomicrobiaceae bacterium]|nr:MFS transporter [Thermomicrobiaceae bacterium]
MTGRAADRTVAPRAATGGGERGGALAAAATEAGTALRHKRATVALLAAMLIVHNAQRMGVVTVFDPLRARYGTDYGGVGTLFSAYVFGYALFQSVVGLFGDRFNAKWLLLSGLALSAAFSVVFAGTHSYAVALVSRFLLGATGALLYTPAFKMGITLFAPQERGRVLGILQAGAGIGSSGAMIAVPFFAGLLGLTGGFLTLPVVAIAVLALAFAVLPDAPALPAPSRAEGDIGVTRRPDFWQLLAISLIGMLAAYGLLTWLPTFLTHTFNYSTVKAGTFSSVSNIALLIAAPVVGMAADLPRGRAGVVVGGSVLAAISFALMIVSGNVALVLGVAVLIGISLSATTAPMMLFAGERFDRRQTARVVGLMSMAAQLGATLAGTVFGVVLARGGSFRMIWVACAVLALIRLAVLANLVWRDRAARIASGRVARAA